jgi:hypothetical protein
LYGARRTSRSSTHLYVPNPNVETTTSTFVSSQTIDNTTDDKITCTFVFGSDPNDTTDSYDVEFFYDNAFGTYVAVDVGSSALRGGTGNKI